MNESIPSLILLAALVVPIAIFLRETRQFSAAKLVHALTMSVICLAMGLLLSAAMIELAVLESELIIASLVLIGSVLSAITRVLWIKRFG